MIDTPDPTRPQRSNRMRLIAWSIASVLLLIPLIAMQFSDEVAWDAADFVIAGLLILGIGLPLEIAVRSSDNAVYRWAIGLALVASVLLIWINGAVGIIGTENNDANLLYAGVLGIGLAGALLARFRAPGMAYAMFATALAQAAVAVGALMAGLASPESGPLEIVMLNGVFVALWASSGVLFLRAAETPPGAGSE